MKFVLTIIAAAAAVAAQNQLADFDDLNVAPIGSSFIRPPTPYKGLNYTGFSLLSNVAGIPIGGGGAIAQPHSAPNAAFFSVASQVTAGGTPSISRANGGLWDLQSFWVSCSINVGLTTVPYKCQIIAAVVAPDQVVTTLATYNIPASANMTKVTFPRQFRGVDKVTIILAGDFADYILSASVDDVAYRLCKLWIRGQTNLV